MNKTFSKGIESGIPIGLGYFAVAFSLGIAAKDVGINAFQGFLASLITIASAGEFAAFRAIGTGATYLELALLVFVTNARYFLMSCSLSQRVAPETSIFHRLGMGFFITDEIFGVSISQEGNVKPSFVYGAALASVPAWAVGTALGIIAGNVLPYVLVQALSVSLYGMFLAIIVPPAKKNRVVAAAVLVSFALSYATTFAPLFKNISEGNRIIILTVVISAVFALLFPVKEESNE